MDIRIASHASDDEEEFIAIRLLRPRTPKLENMSDDALYHALHDARSSGDAKVWTHLHAIHELLRWKVRSGWCCNRWTEKNAGIAKICTTLQKTLAGIRIGSRKQNTQVPYTGNAY